MNGKMVF